MCGRSGCAKQGEPTDTKRCSECGYVTVDWDPEKAERLQQAPVDPYAPSRVRSGIPVATTNELPGWEITDYIGEVFGVIVRSRGAIPTLGANLMSIAGGELGTMTNLLRQTRKLAIDRLVAEATLRGADALVAMRFDVTSMGAGDSWTEICAYGTAVKARRRTSEPEPVGEAKLVELSSEPVA